MLSEKKHLKIIVTVQRIFLSDRFKALTARHPHMDDGVSSDILKGKDTLNSYKLLSMSTRLEILHLQLRINGKSYDTAL